MTAFSYRASDPSGKIVQGSLEADDHKAAVGRLQEMGYIPIRISQAGGKGRRFGLDLSGSASAVFKRITNKDVMVFTQDLSALLSGGLPVDRALSILIEAFEKDRFREIVTDILKTVQGGSYLSDALAKYPRVFSRFYINMVRAGEAGGVLEAVLERLAIFLESSQDLRDFIKSAMIYPIFLILVGGASLIILMTYVIPKFSLIFAEMGGAIPWPTQMLLAVSEALRRYWPILLALLAAAVFVSRRLARSPKGRRRLDRLKLTLPFTGDLVSKVEVARFTRTLGTLTRSGVPILQALQLATDIMGNVIVRESLSEVYERVKEGERLSKPLGDIAVFPPLAIQMIMVGEETGRMDDMLLRVAENYEKVVKNLIKRLVGFLEPAMILLMGVVVGFIVISMLMAIFSMNDMPF